MTNLASSDTKKATAEATSSASNKRFNGVAATMTSMNIAPIRLWRSNYVKGETPAPGQTALTVTLSLANSRAIDLENAITPPFAAE